MLVVDPNRGPKLEHGNKDQPFRKSKIDQKTNPTDKYDLKLIVPGLNKALIASLNCCAKPKHICILVAKNNLRILKDIMLCNINVPTRIFCMMCRPTLS